MRILTHIIGPEYVCLRCGAKIPVVTREGKPLQVREGDRIGVIESNWTEPSAYRITTEHDSNKPCQAPVPEALAPANAS
jgi:hypothetical protein